MNKAKLKSYLGKALAFLAVSAERFVELCLRTQMYVERETPVNRKRMGEYYRDKAFDEPDAFRHTLQPQEILNPKTSGLNVTFPGHEMDSGSKMPKVKTLKKEHDARESVKDAELAKKLSDLSEASNYIPVQDLPTVLYVAEYFTMPTVLRTYGALLQSYKTELLGLIRDHTGCEEHKAVFILESLEFYITQLKAGNKESFEGHTEWLTDYAKMVKIVNAQDKITMATRASCTICFLNTVDVIPKALAEQEQLLDTLKRTGALPAQAPLLLLDIMAFVDIPKYLQRRLTRINVHLGSKLEVSGKFKVN